MMAGEWALVLVMLGAVLSMGWFVDQADVRLMPDEQLRIEIYWAESIAEPDTPYHREYIRRHGALPEASDWSTI